MPDPNIIEKIHLNNVEYLLKDSATGTLTATEITTGTDTGGKFISASVLSGVLGNEAIDTYYGTCSTNASTAQKDVTCANYSLRAGKIIGILFTTSNTAAVPTLNINSTGVISIYVGSSVVNGTTNVLKWSPNTMVYFMYDGTYYRYITSIAAGQARQPRGANTWYGTCGTQSDTSTKSVTIDNYVMTPGSLVSITFSEMNEANVLSLNINSTGSKSVFYNNAVTSSTNKLRWDASETVTFMYDGNYYQFITKSKGGSVSDIQVNGTSILSSGTANIVTNTAYNASTNKIATMADVDVMTITYSLISGTDYEMNISSVLAPNYANTILGEEY